MAETERYEDFEKPILELEQRISELESFQDKAGVDVGQEIAQLRRKCEQRKREIFAKLTAWQRVMMARHTNRPGVNDYLTVVFEDFVELFGDKAFGDDKAILTGLARVGGIKVMLIAQRKGSDTKEHDPTIIARASRSKQE